MKLAICVHVYYPDVFAQLAPVLASRVGRADVFLSCRPEIQGSVTSTVREHGLTVAAIDVVENQGMDVLPFLHVVARHRLHEADAVIKVHTKNPSRAGAAQLDLMVGSLLSDDSIFDTLADSFATRPALCMAGPDLFYRSAELFMYGNRENVGLVQRLMGRPPRPLLHGFFAGNAFWIRASALKQLTDVLPDIIAEEVRQSRTMRTGSDGTIAHALERIYGDLFEGPDADVALVHRRLAAGASPRYSVRVCSTRSAQTELGRRIPTDAIIARLGSLSTDYQTLDEDPERIFDEPAYVAKVGDAIPQGMDPLEHFVTYGEQLGISPSERFHTAFYRLSTPSLSLSENGAAHYLRRGAAEGRVARPTPKHWLALAKKMSLFDGRWYETQYRDVPRDGGEAHYRRYGARFQRPSSAAFDPKQIPVLEHARSRPDAGAWPEPLTTAFLKEHFYAERLEYRLLERLVKEDDLLGALQLAREIEARYGSTDVLRAVESLCFVYAGRWDEATASMASYWARRKKGIQCMRHMKYGAPEKNSRNQDVFGHLTPGRRTARDPATKICVYTSLYGTRSELPPNLSRARGLDFICFTDKRQEAPGWEMRVDGDSGLSPVLAAKRFKVLPHRYLADYEYSLFVDANTLMHGRLDEWVDRYLIDAPFVMWPHPERSDLYRELIAIVEMNRHRPQEVFMQMRHYAAEGLPGRTGIAEASCIWRRHHEPRLIQLMEAWWREITERSTRDQLSLGYLFWKTGVRPKVPPPELGTSRDNPYFTKLPHGRFDRAPLALRKAPISFLYDERAAGSGSTVMRGEQLSRHVRDHFPDREVTFEPNPNPRGRILILTKGFLEAVRADELKRLKERGNCLVADYVDAKPMAEQVEFIDVLLASSIKAIVDYRVKHRTKLCVHLTHHVDPRLPRGNRASGRAVVGYVGERVNAIWSPQIHDQVELVHVDTSRRSDDWLRSVSRFNVHYAARRVRGIDGHKPFLKGFTAAHCDANIIVQRGSGDTDSYLGHHYPYLLSARPDEAEILEMLDRVRETFGGPVWDEGLEVMRHVQSRSCVSFIMDEFRALLRQL